MLYCKNCRLLCKDNDRECPKCGNIHLSVPKDNDSVYLVTKNAIWARETEEILINNKIPYLKHGLLGAGITAQIGNAKERYNFFVPFCAYKKSKELLFKDFKESDI